MRTRGHRNATVKTFLGDLDVLYQWADGFTMAEVTENTHLDAVVQLLGLRRNPGLTQHRAAVLFHGRSPRVVIMLKTNRSQISGVGMVREPRAELVPYILAFLRHLKLSAFFWGEMEHHATVEDYAEFQDLQVIYDHLKAQVSPRVDGLRSDIHRLSDSVLNLQEALTPLTALLDAFRTIVQHLDEEFGWRAQAYREAEFSYSFDDAGGYSIPVILEPHRTLAPKYGREEIDFHLREEGYNEWPDSGDQGRLEAHSPGWEERLHDAMGDAELHRPPRGLDWADASGRDDWSLMATYYFPRTVVEFLTQDKRQNFAEWLSHISSEALLFLRDIEKTYKADIVSNVRDTVVGLLDEIEGLEVEEDEDDEDEDDDYGHRNIRGRRVVKQTRRHPRIEAWEAEAWKRLTTGRGLLILRTSDPGNVLRSRAYNLAKKKGVKVFTKLYWDRKLQTHLVVISLRDLTAPAAGRAASRKRR